MKKAIIEIGSFRDALPRKDTWYRYFNDLFVSVICQDGRTSHIRRKYIDSGDKRDNKMCQWHCDWQYLHIEENYGIRKGKPKTYEITIVVDNIEHRIDSLIETLAIEFQHSLGVSIAEMDHRFVAHKSKGFIPYLVLDFTDRFFAEEMQSCRIPNLRTYYGQPQVINASFNVFERKWFKTKYFAANNLFLDFQDTMVRLSRQLIT